MTEHNVRKECKKLVEDIVFYLLTVPVDWRYERDTRWEVGHADNLRVFIKRNAGYLFNMMQESSYLENFVTRDEDNDDDKHDKMVDIFSVVEQMFPTYSCIHPDDRDNMQEAFFPRLQQIASNFIKE